VIERELALLRRREDAERRRRIAAESRWLDIGRGPIEIDTLDRRVGKAEREVRELASQLRSVQRELAEGELLAATERATGRRAELELRARVTALEQDVIAIQAGLSAERAPRERSERQLESIRRAHRRLERLVRELRGVVRRMDDSGRGRAPGGPPRPVDPHLSDASPVAHRVGRGDSLAGSNAPAGGAPGAGVVEIPGLVEVPDAVEVRDLRGARGGARTTGPSPGTIPRRPPGGESPARMPRPDHPADLASDPSPDRRGSELAEALGAAVERLRARAAGADRLEGVQPGPTGETSPPLVAMSPSKEPLRSGREISWWAAWRARRRARRSR
jgi:hypothetical protein